nr:hypothetical protein BaRGS_029673 [Batillaria attramentaria]
MRYYEGEAREAKPFVAGLGRSGYAACYGPGGDEFDDSQVAPPGEWSTSFDFNERLGVAGRRRGLPLPQEFLPVGQRISKTFPRIPGAAESAAEGGFSSGYLRSESVSRPAARGVDNNGTVEDRNPDAVQLSQKVDEEDSNAGAASSDVTASYLKPGEHYENEGAEHGSVGTADNAYMGERVRIMRIVQAPSTQTSSSSPKYRLAPAPAMTQQRGGSKLPRQAAKYHPHAQYTNFPLSVHEETVYKGQAGWDRTSAAVMPYSSIQETIMIDTLIDTSAGQFGNAVSVADDSWNNAATLAVHFPRDMVTSVRNDGDHALEPQVHYDTAAAAAEEGRNAVDDAPTMAESADAPIARNNDSDLDNRDHGTAFTAAANTAQNQAILQQRYRDDGTFTEVTSQATPLPPQNLGGTSRSVGVNVDTMQATDEKIIRAAGDHATPLGYARTAHDILLIKTDNAYAFPDRRVGESHAYHVELSQQGQERPTRAAAAATHVLPKTGHYWNSSTAAAECAAYRPPQARRIENTKTGDENRAAGPQRDTALTELTCRVSCTPQKSSERAGSSQDLAHLSSASVQELLSAVIHAPGADGAEVMGDPPCPDKVAFVLRKDSSGEITGYVMLDEPSK